MRARPAWRRYFGSERQLSSWRQLLLLLLLLPLWPEVACGLISGREPLLSLLLLLLLLMLLLLLLSRSWWPSGRVNEPRLGCSRPPAREWPHRSSGSPMGQLVSPLIFKRLLMPAPPPAPASRSMG